MKRALVLEMPVLEKGITAAGVLFVPLALALRVSQRGMRAVSRATRRIPRTFFIVDLIIDFARRDPASSLAVLDGITFGRVAPPLEDRRRIAHPTLVIGHPSDPIHPFSDADRTARELPQLVRFYGSWKQFGHGTISLSEFHNDYEQLKAASTVAAWAYGSAALATAGAPEHIGLGRASASLLLVLGVQPAAGRWFTPDEEQPGHSRVIVLGRSLWQRRFNGDPAVVGQTVQISGV